MKNFKLYFSLFFVIGIVNNCLAQSQSQTSLFGLKMGAGVYSFTGGELQNPTPLLGYVAGIYIHDPLEDKRFHVQGGLDIRFRGGNFNNAKTTDSAANRAYTQISLVTLDVPISMLFSLQPNKREKAWFLNVGVIPSYVMRSVVYVSADKIPLNSQVYLQTWDNLPLKPFEFLAHFGVQMKGNQVGYDFGVNIGITDMNDNFRIDGIYPATGTGKRISTVAFEASLLF